MITIALLVIVPALAPTPTPVDVPLLNTKWKPADLAAACEKAEKDTDARLATLVAIHDAKRTFKDSFESFDPITGDYGETVGRLQFMKDIHPDKGVRDAGEECAERSGKYSVALSARKDLYLAMKGYLDNAGKKDKLDDEQKRLVELTMLDFKKAGLELSDADRTKLVAIRSRITELESKGQKNLGEDASKFDVTKKEDLAGLPDDFIKAHEDPKRPGTYVLTTKYPDYYPVMENATNEALRRQM